jgi:UPF0176 protein
MYQVLLFYSYQTIENPEAVAAWVRQLAQHYELTGRALVAEEGINATFEGTTEHTEQFVRDFHARKEFANIAIKRSLGTGDSFPKLSVKVRNEIVGTRFPKEVDPRIKTGKRLTPEELRQWYQDNRDFVIVDMRNNYEFASGHFKNSIQPNLEASRDLPQKVKELEHLKDKTVLTVCTGGVRCEKMSAYLLQEGFNDVYQLDGGIHTYMEKYPGEDYQGTLYTFDKRKVMDFGGDREIIGECYFCKGKTERYENCANAECHYHFLVCADCVPVGEAAYCKEACKK